MKAEIYKSLQCPVLIGRKPSSGRRQPVVSHMQLLCIQCLCTSTGAALWRRCVWRGLLTRFRLSIVCLVGLPYFMGDTCMLLINNCACRRRGVLYNTERKLPAASVRVPPSWCPMGIPGHLFPKISCLSHSSPAPNLTCGYLSLLHWAAWRAVGLPVPTSEPTPPYHHQHLHIYFASAPSYHKIVVVYQMKVKGWQNIQSYLLHQECPKWTFFYFLHNSCMLQWYFTWVVSISSPLTFSWFTNFKMASSYTTYVYFCAKWLQQFKK